MENTHICRYFANLAKILKWPPPFLNLFIAEPSHLDLHCLHRQLCCSAGLNTLNRFYCDQTFNIGANVVKNTKVVHTKAHSVTHHGKRLINSSA